QRPLPQPASKPMASRGRLSQGKSAKYSPNLRRTSSKPRSGRSAAIRDRNRRRWRDRDCDGCSPLPRDLRKLSPPASEPSILASRLSSWLKFQSGRSRLRYLTPERHESRTSRICWLVPEGGERPSASSTTLRTERSGSSSRQRL